MTFQLNPVPEIRFGNGLSGNLAESAAPLSPKKKVLFVADPVLIETGAYQRIADGLEAEGFLLSLYSGYQGEPKLKDIDAAADLARSAETDLVIGLGGGSALDIAKAAACVAVENRPAKDYTMARLALPQGALPKIAVPTTAGTGSEVSATNVMSDDEGRKTWIWGEETKPDLVILDPELTVSVPPAVTAYTGLDAFVHAFEAATNVKTNPGAQLYAHRALVLISSALAVAVREPGNLQARGDLLFASTLAGIAIDNCGTGMAHNISHALAGLVSVPHGLATALALEVVLPWMCERPTVDLASAAAALGLETAADLPGHFSRLLTDTGLTRALPAALAETEKGALAREMRAAENSPMRKAMVREVTDKDIDTFAARMLRLAEG